MVINIVGWHLSAPFRRGIKALREYLVLHVRVSLGEDLALVHGSLQGLVALGGGEGLVLLAEGHIQGLVAPQVGDGGAVGLVVPLLSPVLGEGAS